MKRLLRLGDSKICRRGWPAGDPGKPGIQMKSKGSLLENSLMLGEAGLFVCSGLQLIEWGPLTLWWQSTLPRVHQFKS